MEWCEEKENVCGIFLLKHALEKNDNSYCDLVCKFVRENTTWQKNEVDKKVLFYASDVFFKQHEPISKDRVYIRWLPTYSCALIAKPGQGCQSTQIRYLSLVGLDKWRFYVQSSPDNTKEHTSLCEGYANVTIKHVKENEFETFMECFQEALQKAIADDDTRRRLRTTVPQRHKKTPAFIEAVLKNAHILLENKGKEEAVEGVVNNPRGGWSDVMKHTGGDWPLVSAVFKHLLSYSSHSVHTDVEILHNLFLCQFEMWLLERQLEVSIPLFKNSNSSHTVVVEAVDVVMHMLTLVGRKVARLAEKGHDSVPTFQIRCEWAREELNKAITSRGTSIANKHFIEMDDLDGFLKPSIRLNLPTESESFFDPKDIEKIARKNIEALSLAITHKCPLPSLSDMLAWVNQTTEDQTKLLLLLRTVESVIFLMSKDLNSSANVGIEVELLEKLVEQYRNHVHIFLKNILTKEKGENKSVLRVEVISKEVLVVWVAYCLIHKVLKHSTPLIGEYGVALRWKNICYFVLSDEEAISASLEVSEYLKANSDDLPLFSLTTQEGTFKMAETFTKQSSELSEIWQGEVKAANRRVSKHWEEVTEKQTLVHKLERQVKEENREKENLEYKLKREEEKNHVPYYHGLRQQIRDVESNIRNIENRIRTAKQPPDDVYQPLPRNQSLAARVLFFLHMPKDMEILARVTIMAQQMLLPNHNKFQHTALDKKQLQKIQESTKFPKPPDQIKTNLMNYYNQHYPYLTGLSKTVEIYAKKEPPKTVGPNNVMEFYSKTDGIWYPDNLFPIMVWKGGRFSLDQCSYFFNPFEPVESSNTVDYFTEKSYDESLQWIMPQYGEDTSSSRGNQPIAYQNKKPDWLKKYQWLELANLRAFPNQQLRNVCRILSDRSLPLEHPTVLTVITLALYHIGNITEDLNLEWKTDLFFGDFGKIMMEELLGIADEISTKPRDNRSMLLLIDIAAYVTQWYPACQQVCRIFAGILKEWICDLDRQISNADPKHVIILRTKKALFCKYAILCYAKGVLTRDDAQEMCKLILMTHNDDNMFQENNPYEEVIKCLTIRSRWVICSRLADIVKEAKADKYEMFTTAVKLIIHDTPDYLNWKGLIIRIDGGLSLNASCFEAWSSENDLYSINLANGIVLFNGKPISHLPASILHHPLYVRTFNSRNFEICVSKSVFSTIMPVKGCIYTFELCGEDLIVHEIDTKTKIDLQLLKNDGPWCIELPPRLKEMHSHWYCANKDMILLRDINFCQRNVDFLIKQESIEKSWTCFRVPQHLRKSIWDKFRDARLDVYQFDKLVINSAFRKIFEKFEESQFIQVYSSSKATTIVELPRFKLQFQWRSDSSIIDSLDYSGYCLSRCQQLNDTIMGFKRYLLLERDVDGYKQSKVIIPVGDIRISNGSVDVIGGSSSDSEWNVFSYDIHPRFKNLQASSIGARLQLAELYAATGSLLPERRMKMTGGEVAITLVRQCWTNQPMEENNYARLQNLPNLCHHTPGLSILCYEIGNSSLQTDFLHSKDFHPVIEFPTDASNEYMQRECPCNPKSTLSADEEFRVFGRNRSTNICNYLLPTNYQFVESITKSGVEGIANCEGQLNSFLLKGKKHQSLSQWRNISDSEIGGTTLNNSILTELNQSIRLYDDMPDFAVAAGLRSKIQVNLQKIRKNRQSVEKYLQTNINQVPKDNLHANVFRIMRAANISPLLQLEDMVQAVFYINHLRHFNPFLSKEDLETLNLELLKWLQLCVLEDKLNRLCTLCKNAEKTDDKGSSLQIVKELRNVRTWSVEEHPRWLVFEVLAQLQIRPLQYSVALSIINAIERDSVSPITQLNMGEGKTRVILPMLILHWLKSNKIIRLNFLSSLIQEAYEYLHQNLCSSVFGCKLHTLPFNRDVLVTEEQALTMYKSLDFCESSNGLLLVTPEHRLSLKLKWYEINEKGETDTCKILERIENLPYVDILDECDEILRVRSKLIYACGSHEQLPSGDIRWCVLQTLFRVIKDNTSIQNFLTMHGVAHWKQGYNKSSEAFHEFRIVEGKAFENIKREFYRTLFKELIKEPPYELRGIKKYNLSTDFFVDYVTTPEAEVELPNDTKHKMIVDFLLSLRGYLANGLLVHCLMMRNRVNYGVKRPSKKRMAVPFHAVETPAPRAEFGHPDCAMIYSYLAYYYDGLSEKQIVEAFTILLSLGETAQTSIYEIWYKLSKPSIMKGSCEDKLNSVSKIDLSNGILVKLLVKYYRYNTATINFWLENKVFLIETMQYPNRLEATAWDIATNNANQVAGFSGTNDDKILLPSTVSWIKSNDVELQATDGKMMDLISKHATFHDISGQQSQPSTNDVPQWKKILDVVVNLSKMSMNHTRALIDAGALMAGVSTNKDVAFYLVERLDHVLFHGVVYFDRNTWWVRDHHGRVWPKHLSPIHERDAFVYFDESRCRGADMKLPMTSQAVLTLGPKMCKDKLMQAAGRMRQLENGQKVTMIALDDVTAMICSINSLDNPKDIKPIHVLRWVISNTVTNVAKWLPEWGIQGGHYIIKQDNVDLALLPDMLTLQQMYGLKLSEQPVPDVWKHYRSLLMTRRKGKHLPTHSDNILNDIDNRIQKYGTDVNTVFSKFEEECERELEKEVEIGEEVEKQIPSKQPRSEENWDVHKIVSYSDIHMLNRVPGINMQSLASFIETNIYYEGKPIKTKGIQLRWPNVYGTQNFFFTLERNQIISHSSLNDYLRSVNSCLLFPSTGDILLLSEREADKVLQYSWKAKRMNKCFLVNLTYVRQFYKLKEIKFQTPTSSICKPTVSENVIAALQLYHGDVTYEVEERKNAIKEILDNDTAKSMARLFSTVRGLGVTYQRSDLEEICSV